MKSQYAQGLLKKSTDDLLISAGQEPDSHQAYAITRELQRRVERDRVELHAKQMDVSDWQVKAARASIYTSRWIVASAMAVIVGTIIALLSYLATVF